MIGGVVQRLRDARRAWRDYPLRIGTMAAGRYRIEAFLGMGSYGQAYRAVDTATGTRVLLKTGKPSKGPVGLELLRRESDILGRLSHPGIPAWLDYVRFGGREGLVTELKAGRNLEDQIVEGGRTFTEAEALRILRRLAEPIGHLHGRGFVHRDVRIPNVLERDGDVALIDFGLACVIGERLPASLREGLGETAGGAEPGGGKPASVPGVRLSSARVRLEGTWGAVKRRMRLPEPSSDLYGMGHLLLFLLYAGYEATDGRERSWNEELELRQETGDLIRKLLTAGTDGFAHAGELAFELDRILARMQGDRA